MAIVALMVAARYVPLGAVLRWLVAPAAAPAIVTGSLQDEAQSGRSAARQPRDAASDVRAILAQADERKSNTNSRNERGPARVNRDEVADEEIYIGGTGLVDESGKKDTDHPLAAQHPDDYLVICEAGCRPSSDRIVFQVSKVSAAAAAKAQQRKLEVTSANEQLNAEAPANSNNEIVCIAGCYDDEPVKRRRHASNETSGGARLAQAGTSSSEPEPATVTEAVAKVETASPAPSTAPVAVADAASMPVREASPAPVSVAPASALVETVSLPAAPSATATPAASTPAHTAATTDVSTAPAAQAALFHPPVAAASVSELASVHAISAETAVHIEAKHTRALETANKPPSNPPWRTTVTSLVALTKPARAPRPIVALATPFETTVSVEHGWDFTLSNTP